jgi:hypothetical protein
MAGGYIGAIGFGSGYPAGLLILVNMLTRLLVFYETSI